MLIAFHLGRVYTLSLAELLAVFSQKNLDYSVKELYREILLIETPHQLDLESLEKRLGGVVKIMEIVDILPNRKASDQLSYVVKDYFHPNILKINYFRQVSSKIQFGISIYPLSDKVRLYGQNKKIGLEIKRKLQAFQISCRVVIPEGAALALPSVAVTNNQLLQKGAEIDLLVSEKNIYIGKTAAVQDFVDYGRRDYQRPARDLHVGLVPPKVAQMMINMARIPNQAKNDHGFILDPFVGGGTIVQEAMLMGYKVLGADISQKAVDDAEKNLNWFRTRYKLPPNRFELLVSDVRSLKKAIEERPISGVVTEGTLGPAYINAPDKTQIEKNFTDLAKTYLAAFEELKKILQAGQTIVAALPAYRVNDGYVSFPIIDKILKLGYAIVAPLPTELTSKYKFLKVTPRNSIIYDRKDQVVVREIMIFKTIDN